MALRWHYHLAGCDSQTSNLRSQIIHWNSLAVLCVSCFVFGLASLFNGNACRSIKLTQIEKKRAGRDWQMIVLLFSWCVWVFLGPKRSSRAADTPSRVGRATQRDSNSNPISPVPTGPRETEEEEGVVETEAATSLDHCQSESYHWCEEDDLTSSEAATSTDKTIGSSADPDSHSAEEYAEMAKKVDLNLAHIDMENFKSADLFQSEQIRSLLIEYNRPILCSQSQLSQVRLRRLLLDKDSCQRAAKNSYTNILRSVGYMWVSQSFWEGAGGGVSVHTVVGVEADSCIISKVVPNSLDR